LGRKERREREKELRRKQIQEAAQRVFMRKGFNLATMEDIAEEAELSTGAIYSYFKGKEELFSSLALMQLNYLFERAKTIYTNKKLSHEKKLKGFWDAMFKTFQNNELMQRNIFHIQLEDTLSTINPELLMEMNDISQKVMRMIAAVYEDGVSKGKFIKGNSMAFADMLWGFFTGLVMWEEAKRKINPKKKFLKPTLDAGFDILLRGIVKKE